MNDLINGLLSGNHRAFHDIGPFLMVGWAHFHRAKHSLSGLRILGGKLEVLNSTNLLAAAVTTGVIPCSPRNMLVLPYRIQGYSAGDIASWRFNADAGNTYQTRYATVAVATVTFTNVATLTTSLLRLAGSSITGARSGISVISNVAGQNKVCANFVMDAGAAVGTEPILNLCGGGTWFNTAAQINNVEMRTAGGVNTLTAGTGFAILGMDL